jgi:hypothetical protein
VLEAAGVPTGAASGSIVLAPFDQTLISRLGREPATLGLMVDDAGTYRA